MALTRALIDQITQRLLVGRQLYRQDLCIVQVGGPTQVLTDLRQHLGQFGGYEDTRIFIHAHSASELRELLTDKPTPVLILCCDLQGNPDLTDVSATVTEVTELLEESGMLVIYDRIAVQSKWIEASEDGVMTYPEYQRLLRDLGLRVRQFTAAGADQRSALVAQMS